MMVMISLDMVVQVAARGTLSVSVLESVVITLATGTTWLLFAMLTSDWALTLATEGALLAADGTAHSTPLAMLATHRTLLTADLNHITSLAADRTTDRKLETLSPDRTPAALATECTSLATDQILLSDETLLTDGTLLATGQILLTDKTLLTTDWRIPIDRTVALVSDRKLLITDLTLLTEQTVLTTDWTILRDRAVALLTLEVTVWLRMMQVSIYFWKKNNH